MSMRLTPKQLNNFWSKVHKRPDGVWEWTGSRVPFGHGQFLLNYKPTYAHRISWELANGPIPTGMCVLHKNDIPYDVNPDNLFLGTIADNNKDRDLKNRQNAAKGGVHGLAKLTEQQVHTLRYWYATKLFTQKQLALSFKIGQSQVNKVILNKQWGHLQ